MVLCYGTREKLISLLNQDLSFRDNKRYRIHNIHAFAAKFPPQLPRHFIEGLTTVGETVLDPMVGSGVSIVEAWLLGRNAIGVDLDPLAAILSRARTQNYNEKLAVKAGELVISKAIGMVENEDLIQGFLEKRDDVTKDFINYWFAKKTQAELAALIISVMEEPNEELRDLFLLIFSSVIITKSGGVSLARDLAHTRPHRVQDKTPKNAIAAFSCQFEKAMKAIKEINSIQKGNATIISGDCRNLPLPKQSVDLIVTSPPYANAIDYMRANKFSLVWLGRDIAGLSTLRSQYIGSEKTNGKNGVKLPAEVIATCNKLERKDAAKARVLKKYFQDMELALREMYRVLRSDRSAIVVVGPSTMRGLKIQTHEHLASIASTIGFEVIGNVSRPIDRDRRMMPLSQNGNSDSNIEQRIHEEFVLGLLKS